MDLAALTDLRVGVLEEDGAGVAGIGGGEESDRGRGIWVFAAAEGLKCRHIAGQRLAFQKADPGEGVSALDFRSLLPGFCVQGGKRLGA